MNIEIQKTKKNAALLRAMASDDVLEAMKARSAFAAYITEPILQVIESQPVLQQLFTPYTYDYGTPSTIPLAPLFDIKDAGFVRVWAQSRPGGLATSSNVDVSELPVTTYGVEGAVSLPLNFIRAARVDVLAAYLEHLAQNFLVKTEVNSAAVISNMAAQTTYKLRGTDTYQVYRTKTQGTVVPQDVSALERIMARVNSSWVGGTPAGASRSITTLVGSPEFGEQIRNMAFEPLNTKGASTSIPSSDKFRDDIYESPNPSIYGMELVTVFNMGINETYNILFANGAGSRTYAGYNAGTAVAFSPGSEQVVYAVNKRVKSLAVLSESNPDDGSTMSVKADNQFSNRAEEIGFYAKKREGRVAIDGKGVVTMIW